MESRQEEWMNMGGRKAAASARHIRVVTTWRMYGGCLRVFMMVLSRRLLVPQYAQLLPQSRRVQCIYLAEKN